MARCAVQGGVDARQGEPRQPVRADFFRVIDELTRRVALLTVGTELALVNVEVAAHAGPVGTTEFQRGMTGATRSGIVGPLEGEAGPRVFERAGDDCRCPTLRRMANAAVVSKLPVRVGRLWIVRRAHGAAQRNSGASRQDERSYDRDAECNQHPYRSDQYESSMFHFEVRVKPQICDQPMSCSKRPESSAVVELGHPYWWGLASRLCATRVPGPDGEFPGEKHGPRQIVEERIRNRDRVLRPGIGDLRNGASTEPAAPDPFEKSRLETEWRRAGLTQGAEHELTVREVPSLRLPGRVSWPAALKAVTR